MLYGSRLHLVEVEELYNPDPGVGGWVGACFYNS